MTLGRWAIAIFAYAAAPSFAWENKGRDKNLENSPQGQHLFERTSNDWLM
jgi:hypothetical protein